MITIFYCNLAYNLLQSSSNGDGILSSRFKKESYLEDRKAKSGFKQLVKLMSKFKRGSNDVSSSSLVSPLVLENAHELRCIEEIVQRSAIETHYRYPFGLQQFQWNDKCVFE